MSGAWDGPVTNSWDGQGRATHQLGNLDGFILADGDELVARWRQRNATDKAPAKQGGEGKDVG
jgi:hypothetical protein